MGRTPLRSRRRAGQAPAGSQDQAARGAGGSAADDRTSGDSGRHRTRRLPRLRRSGGRDPATGPMERVSATAATRSPGAARTAAQLVMAAHPRQALLTAGALAAFAGLSGRSTAGVLLVLCTVLTGQTILGWHNDLVDRERDHAADLPGKPVADGRLDPGTVWFSMALAVLVLVPLAVSNGVTAGSVYLVALAVGLLGNVLFRGSVLSPLPWMVQYAIYPAFLSYGGFGGGVQGDPPQVAVVVLAALLGLGVHVLRALPGLVADNRAGLRHLPLRLGLKLGATKLLVLGSVWTAGIGVALLLTVRSLGIGQ